MRFVEVEGSLGCGLRLRRPAGSKSSWIFEHFAILVVWGGHLNLEEAGTVGRSQGQPARSVRALEKPTREQLFVRMWNYTELT